MRSFLVALLVFTIIYGSIVITEQGKKNMRDYQIEITGDSVSIYKGQILVTTYLKKQGCKLDSILIK